MNRNPFRAIGFCNGLFCLFNDLNGYTYTIIVWNPAIRKSLLLHKPRPPVPLKLLPLNTFCHGFGFDSITHDFKVVRIAYPKGYGRAFEVEVYSLSTGLWKTLNSNDIRGQIYQNWYCPATYLNGTIHWVSYVLIEGDEDTTINSLLLFDVSNETFTEVSLPQRLVHVSPSDLLVTLCGEQISVVWHDSGELVNRCVVWVMNQYGEPESWTEKFDLVLEHEILCALGFRGTRDFLFKRFRGDFMSYDPESKKFKDVDIHGEGEPFFSNKYVESLVLLDGSGGATADPCDDDASDLDKPTG